MKGNADTAVENNDNLLLKAIDDSEAREEMIEGLADEMYDDIVKQGYAYKCNKRVDGGTVRADFSTFDFMFEHCEDDVIVICTEIAKDAVSGMDLSVMRESEKLKDVLHKACKRYVTANLESILNGESH